MKNYNLMGIVIENRREKATIVQDVLTGYGCIIKMRIGLHEGTENECSNEGFIILNLSDNQDEINRLIMDLSNIDGVRVRNVKIQLEEDFLF